MTASAPLAARIVAAFLEQDYISGIFVDDDLGRLMRLAVLSPARIFHSWRMGHFWVTTAIVVGAAPGSSSCDCDERSGCKNLRPGFCKAKPLNLEPEESAE